jgi:hypothetical protein
MRRKKGSCDRKRELPLIFFLLLLVWLFSFCIFRLVLPKNLTQTRESSFELTVMVQALNMRSGPGSSFEKVAVLDQGLRVPVLRGDDESGWLMVRLAEGIIGWVSGSKKFVSVSSDWKERDRTESNYSRFLINTGPAAALSLLLVSLLSIAVFVAIRRKPLAVSGAVFLLFSLLLYAGFSDYFVGFQTNSVLDDARRHLPVLRVHNTRELARRVSMINQVQDIRRQVLHKPIGLFIEEKAWPVTFFTISLFSEPLNRESMDSLKDVLIKAESVLLYNR